MVYICADDYGLCDSAVAHIEQCIEDGVLNKVSVFPNLDSVDLTRLSKYKNLRISLHLNLVEGKAMADPEEISLLADRNGMLKHRFGGLFWLGLFRGKELEGQLYREIKAQVTFWKEKLPAGVPFCVDSHQHTHMIPAVFRVLLQVLCDEEIDLAYLRIPAEPLMPYLKTPSLYHTYHPVNLVKQWLLKGLWLRNQKEAKGVSIPTAYFFGILFSGRMDEPRVKKILPKYMKLAEQTGCDIEVLFHPGYTQRSDLQGENKNIVFDRFYLSEDRKTEFDSVKKLSERSGQECLILNKTK